MIILPYIKGIFDKLANILKRRNIKVTFTLLNAIRRMVDSSNDSIDLKLCKGVYSIPCSCVKVYIDQIGRSIDVRFKEHLVDLRHDSLTNLP